MLIPVLLLAACGGGGGGGGGGGSSAAPAASGDPVAAGAQTCPQGEVSAAGQCIEPPLNCEVSPGQAGCTPTTDPTPVEICHGSGQLAECYSTYQCASGVPPSPGLNERICCPPGLIADSQNQYCVTPPPPTCTPPQILNSTATGCETPPACAVGATISSACLCLPPDQSLSTGICGAPANCAIGAPVNNCICASPNVMQNGNCVAACTPPDVANNGECAAPPVLTCAPPQVPNAAGTACVLPACTTVGNSVPDNCQCPNPLWTNAGSDVCTICPPGEPYQAPGQCLIPQCPLGQYWGGPAVGCLPATMLCTAPAIWDNGQCVTPVVTAALTASPSTIYDDSQGTVGSCATANTCSALYWSATSSVQDDTVTCTDANGNVWGTGSGTMTVGPFAVDGAIVFTTSCTDVANVTATASATVTVQAPPTP